MFSLYQVFLTIVSNLLMIFVYLFSDDYCIKEIFFSIISIVALILSIFLFYKYSRISIKLPFVLFYISLNVHSFSIFWLRSLGFNIDIYSRFFEIYKIHILDAFLYSYLFISLFPCLLFILDRYKQSNNEDYRFDLKIYDISFFIFVVSGSFYFYAILKQMLFVIVNGYSALYEKTEVLAQTMGVVESFVYFLSNLFIPSYFFLFSYSCFFKKKRLIYIYLIILVVLFIITMITGGRSTGLSLILAFYFIYTRLYKKISINGIWFKVPLLFFLLTLIPVIAEFRTSDLTLENFILIFSDKLNSNILVDIFSTFGFSFFPLLAVFDNIPVNYSFGYGESFLRSVLALIPSFLVGQNLTGTVLDEWLQNILRLDFGAGFSLIAEFYYNFSWYGLVLAPISGLFFGYVLCVPIKKESKVLSYALIAACLFSFILTARSSTMLILRTIVYFVYGFFIIVNLYAKFRR